MHLLSLTKAHEQVNDALSVALGGAWLYGGDADSPEDAGEALHQDDFAPASENEGRMDTWAAIALDTFSAFPEDITDAQAAQALSRALMDAMDGVYDCNRVWSAWDVKTMTGADFIPLKNDDERAQDIGRGVLLSLAHQTDHPVLVNGALDHFREAHNWRGLEQFAMDDDRPQKMDWLTEVAASLSDGQMLRPESLAVLRQDRASGQAPEENSVSRRRVRP